LTHIAGPVERHHAAHRALRDLRRRLGRELRHEVLDEQRNVLAPLAERRQRDLEDVQPVEEILAERALGNHPLQRRVGGGNDPHVHLDRLVATQTLEGALLQRPQQFALQPRLIVRSRREKIVLCAQARTVPASCRSRR
jgi:hypothetical protein